MLLQYLDEIDSFDTIVFDEKQRCFFLSSKKTGTNLICKSPLQFEKDEETNFELFILKNKRDDYSENSIFQVYIGKKRIGWIFPLQSLLSDEHDYANDKHFLQYAYVAFYKLLNLINDNYAKNNDSSNEFNLDDYYDNDALFVVFKEAVSDTVCEKWLDNYLVSFYSYGFAKNGEGNLHKAKIEFNNGRIKLKKNSDYICKKLIQIPLLFDTVVSTEAEQPQFVRFLMYYQFIELFMGAILEEKLKVFFSSYSPGHSRQLIKSKEIIDRTMAERTRINSLFSDYSRIPSPVRDQVKNSCQVFLRSHCKDEGGDKDFSSLLYDVRCFIVHSLYLLDSSAELELEKVNNAFLELLEELMFSFDLSTSC